jgi:low temperature requirement protein LtrA
VLLQMLLISLTTLTFVDREATNNDYLGLAYGAAVLSVAALHHRVAASDIAAAPWARARRNRLLLAGVLLMANTALPDWADYAMFLAAILVLVVPTSVGAKLRRPPSVDVHHLTERAALLTLIMCGEAFVKVALVVSEGSIERQDLVAILVEFVVVFAFFWTYFDDVPQAGIRPGPFHGEPWVLAHLPLQIGIVTIAIAMSKFLQVDHVHDEVVAILGVGWVLVFCGLALIGLQGQRVPRRPLLLLRLGTAALAAALALLDWYALWIWPELFVGLLTLLTVFHAVVARALRFQTTVVGAAASGAPH